MTKSVGCSPECAEGGGHHAAQRGPLPQFRLRKLDVIASVILTNDTNGYIAKRDRKQLFKIRRGDEKPRTCQGRK